MKYSIIVPVFNRPNEVEELLESLTKQSLTDFEVLIVEDGSQITCEEVCKRYAQQLDIKYFIKSNNGPGMSRNYGAERAQGDYLLILDSDVVLPPDYLKSVDDELEKTPVDAFGGPDRAHESFTDTQKAISYSMTSFFTTGGIRGGKKKLDKFYPRSFNMGIRREVYQQLGGFSNMRFGEDIDFSIRIFKAGYRCRLFPTAWVWHKRRTDFRKFWRQVYNSGIARINLYMKYPDSLKFVHVLPAAFTFACAQFLLMILNGLILYLCTMPAPVSIIGVLLMVCGLAPISLYSLIILIDSTRQNHSFEIGIWSIFAAYIQLIGYGCGFFEALWKRIILRHGSFSAYEKTFYQ